MKREDAARDTFPAPAWVEFDVQFSRGPKGKRRVRAVTDPGPAATPAVRPTANERPRQTRPARLAAATIPVEATQSAATPEPQSVCPVSAVPAPPRVPKVVLLLVLGHHFELLVREGILKDYAEIARRTGLTRARVTQICDLTLLAPEIQEKVLFVDGHSDDCRLYSERSCREILRVPGWSKQKEPAGSGMDSPLRSSSAVT